MSERQAKAQPCFIPLMRYGNEAGRITFVHLCNPVDPIVFAARAKIGGILRTPVSVAMTTDQTVPITTTNNMALSVWPNQSNANGTQYTLGSVWNPSASTPMVSSMNFEAEVKSPSGRPIRIP